MREIKNTAEVSLTIRLLTFTMYFSSPHLLCLQATKCMMQLHAQIENLKTETGSKEAAATTPKLCALSPKSQPSQGSVKKKDTIRGVSGGASYIQQQPDFDLTDYSWAGERMRYPSLDSPSLSLLRLLQHQITCSIHQMFLFFGEFI